jgi:two-component system LytT family sensor kinase
MALTARVRDVLQLRPITVPAPTRAATDSDGLWPVIWAAGGACWLVIALIGLLWAWPVAGTYQDGELVVTSGTRLVHHGLLFLASAVGYRLGLGRGWPGSVAGRVRVIALNVLLALIVVRLAPLVLALSVGIAESSWQEIREQTASWELFQPTLAQWAWLLRFWMPPYVLGLAVVALVRVWQRYHRETMRLAYLSTEYANLRMAMLSAQLQPHFLFNSLHAIAELVNENPPRAVEMLARLGDFLRYALESSKQPWVRVSAEVAGVEAYLAVQQTRFRDRLRVQLAVEPDTLNDRVPALLLQPIIENAIEHGRSGPDESVTVSVAIRRDGERLRVRVTNSTPRLSQVLPRTAYGDGLRNVDARLHAAYGGAATFTLGPDAERGTVAELDMPLEGPTLVSAEQG